MLLLTEVTGISAGIYRSYMQNAIPMLCDLGPWSAQPQVLLKEVALFVPPPLQLSLWTQHKQLLHLYRQ